MMTVRKGLVLVTLLGLFLIKSYGEVSQDNQFKMAKALDIYFSVYEQLLYNFVDSIDPEEFVNISIDKALTSLDPYTTYYPEDNISDLNSMTTGSYGGIGCSIQLRDDKVYIVSVVEGFPAQKAGIEKGDLLEKIDDWVVNNDIEGVGERLRGKQGLPVEVTIRKPFSDEQLVLSLQRENIKRDPVQYSTVMKDSIGYILLSAFTQYSANEFKKAFISLKAQGIKKLIIDLRNNGGGLLDEAVQIVNLFIPSNKLVVETKGRVASYNRTYKTEDAPLDLNIPLVVLINQETASASEILAGSLQDYDRAVIMGNRSFGKGVVQIPQPVSYNGALKLTVSKYYIPSGRCIQYLDHYKRKQNSTEETEGKQYSTANGRLVYEGAGIHPDVEVETPTVPELGVQMWQEQLFFDFATRYHRENPSIGIMNDFRLSDQSFNDFIAFARQSDFQFKSDAHDLLEDLKKALKHHDEYGSTIEEIASLETKLSKPLEEIIAHEKEDIVPLLEQEIIGRYYYTTGEIAKQLEYDPLLKKAITTLQTPNKYEKILSPKTDEEL